MKERMIIAVLAFICLSVSAFAQEKHYFQSDFPPEEFAERRARVFEDIGNNSIAIIQSAADVNGFVVFRQSNTFYYLSGLETPHSYLVLDGRRKTATVYLPRRNEGRERSEGKTLALEDADLITKLTGLDRVRGIEFLSQDLAGSQLRPPAPLIYTPLSPVEKGQDSRDELLRGQSRIAANPFDERISKEAHLKNALQKRFPQFEVRDLSPTLDTMRLIKSKREIALVREATRIAGLAIIEAMRSTKPGVYEYELDAVAKYIFYANGARGEGYSSIIAGGKNAWMGHYFRKTDKLQSGGFVLMDFAPDYRYYTSDVTRIWPVNGKFTKDQRQLAEFVAAYRDALFRPIKPGITSEQVLDAAASEMAKWLSSRKIVNPIYLKAMREGLKFRGHFQHSVGMAVHDVGTARGVKLKPGMIFTIDPMIWIPEEKMYVRIEDMAVVTETGVENMSAFVPSLPNEIERVMKEQGIVQFRPSEKTP